MPTISWKIKCLKSNWVKQNGFDYPGNTIIKKAFIWFTSKSGI